MSLREIASKIKSLRSHPSDYPELMWAIFVFLGGAINAVAIKNFVDWYLGAQQYAQTNFHTDLLNVTSAYPAMVLYGSIVFVIPIIVSILFTRLYPEKRLVPPQYMQLVSIGLLVAIVYNSLSIDFLNYYFIAILSFSAGIVQDGIMLKVFGRTIVRDNIIQQSLRVHADFEKVKALMMTKQFLRLRGLRIVKGKAGESLKFKTQRGWRWQRNIGYQFVLEAIEGDQPDETLINIVAYELQSYSIKHINENDDTVEFTLNRIAALRDYFGRQEIWSTDDPASNAGSLVRWVMDEMEGMFTRIQEMSTRKILVIISSVGSFIVSIGFLAVGSIDTGVAVLALAAFLVLDGVFRE